MSRQPSYHGICKIMSFIDNDIPRKIDILFNKVRSAFIVCETGSFVKQGPAEHAQSVIV